MTRDYLTLRVWDLAMEKRPVARIPFHDHLRSQLSHLYENDCIFDKFDFASSPDSKYLVGGSYCGAFTVAPLSASQPPVSFEACKPKTSPSGFFGSLSWGRSKRLPALKPIDLRSSQMDIGRKSLRCAWNPAELSFAIGLGNSVFIYSAVPSS